MNRIVANLRERWSKLSQNQKLGYALGGGLLAAILLIAIIVAILSSRDAQMSVRDVEITNLTDTAFTVTWVSDSPYVGQIAYQEGDGYWPAFFAQADKKFARDDRDIELAQDATYVLRAEGAKERYTHHVTVRDLKPNTKYAFRIAGAINGHDTRFPYIYTRELITDLNTPDPAYGKVELGRENPNLDYIVLANLLGSDRGLSSTYLTSNNTYSFDLHTFQTEYKKSDVLGIKVTGPGVNSYTELGLIDYTPLNTIVVKKDEEQPQATASVLGLQSGESARPVQCSCPAGGQGYILNSEWEKFALTYSGNCSKARTGFTANDTNHPPILKCEGGSVSTDSPSYSNTADLTGMECTLGKSEPSEGGCDGSGPYLCLACPALGDNVGRCGFNTNVCDPSIATRPRTGLPAPTVPTQPSGTISAVPEETATGAGVTTPNDGSEATFQFAELTQLCTAEAGKPLLMAPSQMLGDCANVKSAGFQNCQADANTIFIVFPSAPIMSSYKVARGQIDKLGKLGTRCQGVQAPSEPQVDAYVPEFGVCNAETYFYGSAPRPIDIKSADMLPTDPANYAMTSFDNSEFCFHQATEKIQRHCNPGYHRDGGNCVINDATQEVKYYETVPFVKVGDKAYRSSVSAACSEVILNSTNDETINGFESVNPDGTFKRTFHTMAGCDNFSTQLVLQVATAAVPQAQSFFLYFQPTQNRLICSSQSGQGTVIRTYSSGGECITGLNDECSSRGFPAPTAGECKGAGKVYFINDTTRKDMRCQFLPETAATGEEMSSFDACVVKLTSECTRFNGTLDSAASTCKYESSGLIPAVIAQESPASRGAVLGAASQEGFEASESGRYAFFRDGERIGEQDVIVSEGEVKIELFEDTNGNGSRDGSEKFIEDYSKITIAREASIETFNLSAGWNLINIPMIDTRTSDTIKTAEDLIDYWNGQNAGVTITNVARYRNGQFQIFSKRESGNSYSPDFNLIPGEALFVLNRGVSAQLTFSGNKFTEGVPLKLSNGWNLVGIMQSQGASQINSEDVLKKMSTQGIKGEIISQFENGNYQSVISKDNSLFGNNFNIADKRGYFIKVTDGGGQEFKP
jgi:hypothetical protein